MNITYDKLWKRIEKMGLTKKQLRIMADLGPYTITSMSKNEYVHLETISKICAALNCSIDDVVTVVGDDAPLSPLPYIDFDADTYEVEDLGTIVNDDGCLGLQLLGYHTLNDFPRPITAKSISQHLTKLFCNCSLNTEECEWLIEQLEESGIHVQITPGLYPEADMIKASLPVGNDEDENYSYFYLIKSDLEWRKVDNYVMWRINEYYDAHKNNLYEAVSNYQMAEEMVLAETGILHTNLDVDGFNYEGVNCEFVQRTAYPINLLRRIFGEKNVYILADCMDLLKEQMDDILDTLTPREEFFLRLMYQYGMNINAIASFLELPQYETVFTALQERFVNRALRKLRHPSRSKNLFRLFLGHSSSIPFTKPNHRNDNAYEYCRSNISQQVAESLKQGTSVFDALKPFYEDIIIARVVKSPLLWDAIPEIKIDELKLSWQLRLITKKHGISTLKDLVTAHGIDISLDDADKSKLPFEKPYVIEALERLKEYCPVNFEYDQPILLHESIINIDDEQLDEYQYEPRDKYYDKAKIIVDVAEKLVLNDSDKPTIPFGFMNSDIADAIFSMGYRQVDQLTIDYQSGKFESKLKGRMYDAQFSQRILNTTKQIATGKFDTMAFYSVLPEHWQQGVQDPLLLPKIRTAYFADAPLPYGEICSEDQISALFPDNHLAFELVRATRSGERAWHRVSTSSFQPQLIEGITDDAQVYIEKMYTSPYDSSKFCNFLFISATKGSIKHYYLVKIDITENTQKCFLWPEHGESLAKCIEFVENLEQSLNIATDKLEKNEGDWRLSSLEDISLEDMNLSVRAYNCLKRHGIKNAAELMLITTYDDFLRIRNLGLKSIEEIIRWFTERGIQHPAARD